MSFSPFSDFEIEQGGRPANLPVRRRPSSLRPLPPIDPPGRLVSETVRALNSPFSDLDGGLSGDAASYGYGNLLRDFEIRIEGSFPGTLPAYTPVVILTVLSNWGKNKAGIRALLETKGWIISSVSDESGWTGNYIYRIKAVVGSHYTDAQLAAQINSDLAGFFTVAGSSVLSGAYTPPSGVVNAGNVGTVTVYGGTQPPAPNYGVTPPATAPGSQTPGVTSALDNLALGVGLSSPWVVLGGALILMLAMRR